MGDNPKDYEIEFSETSTENGEVEFIFSNKATFDETKFSPTERKMLDMLAEMNQMTGALGFGSNRIEQKISELKYEIYARLGIRIAAKTYENERFG